MNYRIRPYAPGTRERRLTAQMWKDYIVYGMSLREVGEKYYYSHAAVERRFKTQGFRLRTANKDKGRGV